MARPDQRIVAGQEPPTLKGSFDLRRGGGNRVHALLVCGHVVPVGKAGGWPLVKCRQCGWVLRMIVGEGEEP